MNQLTKDEAQRFHTHQTYTLGRLVIWSVTTGTRDYGNRYVARPIVVPERRPREEDGGLIANSLDELRKLLPLGLTWMDRNPNDDPVIVETWF
jgi:hypothetical protein